jgi:hypothetical protein
MLLLGPNAFAGPVVPGLFAGQSTFGSNDFNDLAAMQFVAATGQMMVAQAQAYIQAQQQATPQQVSLEATTAAARATSGKKTRRSPAQTQVLSLQHVVAQEIQA